MLNVREVKNENYFEFCAGVWNENPVDGAGVEGTVAVAAEVPKENPPVDGLLSVGFAGVAAAVAPPKLNDGVVADAAPVAGVPPIENPPAGFAVASLAAGAPPNDGVAVEPPNEKELAAEGCAGLAAEPKLSPPEDVA